jgi:hypothetical protein
MAVRTCWASWNACQDRTGQDRTGQDRTGQEELEPWAEGKLVLSTTQGRFAVEDATYRPDTSSGRAMDVWMGDQWIAGQLSTPVSMTATTSSPMKAGFVRCVWICTFVCSEQALRSLAVGRRVRFDPLPGSCTGRWCIARKALLNERTNRMADQTTNTTANTPAPHKRDVLLVFPLIMHTI